jgi:hypothetical protein
MTNQIQSITADSCREIREQINETLQSLGSELGVSIRAGNAKYDSHTISFKLNVGIIQDGEVMTPELKFLQENNKMLGIPDEWLSSILRTPKGKFFYLKGYKPRAYKRPFIVEDAVTKKRYLTTESDVKTWSLANN